jgi:hypothetical protein
MLAYVLDKRDLHIKDVLEFDEYTFKEDIDYNDKSTVTFIKQPNLEDGDMVICKDGNKTVFFSICEKIKSESGETDYTITLLQKENLFNRFIFSENTEIIEGLGIEDFIVQTIKQNFINSNDLLLDKEWLNIQAETHTKATAKPDTEQGVYNLKTFLGNAKQYWGVYTDFRIYMDRLLIKVEKKVSTELMVDIEVSDVSDYVENYDISVLAKLNVKWKKAEESTEEVRKSFYLLADRTVSENVNDPNRVEGSVKSIQIVTEKEADMRQQVFNEFASNRYNHKITFNIVRNSKLYPEQEFYIGRPCTIKTKSGVRKSMITKIETSSNSALLKITLGNMKVTLTDKLRR